MLYEFGIPRNDVKCFAVQGITVHQMGLEVHPICPFKTENSFSPVAIARRKKVKETTVLEECDQKKRRTNVRVLTKARASLFPKTFVGRRVFEAERQVEHLRPRKYLRNLKLEPRGPTKNMKKFLAEEMSETRKKNHS